MKLNDLQTIDDRVEQGAWVGDLRNLPGVRLKVRGEMNAAYEALLAKLWGEVPISRRDDPAEEERIHKTLLLDTVLLDWSGFEGEPYSREAAAEALEVRTFRAAVVLASRVVAARGAATLEADAKN